jgi:hypothetical protein
VVPCASVQLEALLLLLLLPLLRSEFNSIRVC